MAVMKVVTAFEVRDKIKEDLFFYSFSGGVAPGAMVERFKLAGAGVVIPAVLVGEEGRGRELGVLPVALPPAEEEKLNGGGRVRIYAARVGQTRSGRPKLFWADPAGVDTADVIVVVRTPIGFRGTNRHYVASPEEEGLPFPVLARGRIAQGEAGRMGAGEQLVLILPDGAHLNIKIGGRRYGMPTAYILRNVSGDVQLVPAAEAPLND